MNNKCTNESCEKHTEVTHSNCILTGRNRCQDMIHIKTCWTKEDLDLLSNVLENYV